MNVEFGAMFTPVNSPSPPKRAREEQPLPVSYFTSSSVSTPGRLRLGRSILATSLFRTASAI